MSDDVKQWYVVHTRSRFEQKVHDGIAGKSIEAFLPKVQVMSRRKDRKKKILVPILPGYVFVRTDMHPEEYLSILQTAGVVRMIGFQGKPVPAREDEINSLMILNGTDNTVQNRDYMNKGDIITIMEGPLKGIVGYYLHHKDGSDKVVVSVELLQRSLEIEVDGVTLEKVK